MRKDNLDRDQLTEDDMDEFVKYMKHLLKKISHGHVCCSALQLSPRNKELHATRKMEPKIDIESEGVDVNVDHCARLEKYGYP